MKINKGKPRIKKILIITMLMIAIFNASYSVLAASGTYQTTFFFGRNTVIKGEDSFMPDYSSYPYSKKNVKAIGFDKLYGDNKSLIEYYGEIPYNLKDEEDRKSVV